MKGQIKAGTFTGTGAAINVPLGFIPDFLFVVNVTDGDLIHTWFNGMTAGTTVDIGAAAVANADNGITAYAGSAGANPAGFTAGTDISESGKVYRYFAVANQ